MIVDDELNIRRILEMAFERHGWAAVTAADADEAVAVLSRHAVDCVLTDVTMPGRTGLQLQAEIAERWPETPVVIMTAFGTIPQAVQAIRNGAFEFVTKPFDLDALKKVVGAAMEGSRPTKKPRRGRKAGEAGSSFIAESPAMQEVLDTVRRAADSRATVLVTGESGTGKEVVAKLLHQLSPRAEKPFVAVSCAALPETLLESELFGHEKGAFTGAQAAKPGRFELADEGTLFLDEIGDVPMAIQVKLLRVLQEREFERLGATRPTRVDVRLVTATNRDLQTAVDEGIFRLDLMYRLQVVEIALPPLRERVEDIKPLAEHFLSKISVENDRALAEVSPEALASLTSYSWPGNVRELENTIERAVVLAAKDETVLLPRHLPKTLQAAA
ncbi:MAG: sigma-54-dependent Fis family transcriptional regulator [Fimbriimonadaceae bacterium]|nr:sigma-54-dependent Fis family transcriptional regulator [Fimbriimonadaceae bacterium]QYK57070.1 MAG: sigma-54-dependent Fis family transcriptional regulator [Fimbriimonadaceae bacterium]